MTTKKSPSDWAHNDDKYPQKLGTCDHCGDFDRVKLAFDRQRWICIDAEDCLRAARKQRQEASVLAALQEDNSIDVVGFLTGVFTN